MLLQCNCKHVSVGPSPTPAVVNHRVHNEYPKKPSFRPKIRNSWHLWAKTVFFLCAGGPATPDMLLHYNCKHVSVGPSPTPAVVNPEVHNEYQNKTLFSAIEADVEFLRLFFIVCLVISLLLRDILLSSYHFVFSSA